MKRLISLGVLALAAVGIATYLHGGIPDIIQRLRYPLRYEAIVRGHARNYDLDPALLAAVIYQESKFHADAKSDSGAIGLMQLLPSTAHGIALHTGGSRFRTFTSRRVRTTSGLSSARWLNWEPQLSQMPALAGGWLVSW